MPRISLLVCALAASVAFAPTVRGQTLLDKVEKRVEKALDRIGGAPPADAAAPAELPPPAAAPRTGGDDLPPPAAAPDEPKSGYLGVVLEEVDGGVTIAEVTKDSPAEKAGLKAGDMITAVNRSPVKDIEELGRRMELVPPGGKLTLTIGREGKESLIVATLGQPPKPAGSETGEVELGGPLGPGAGERAPAPAPAPREEAGPQRASLGISVVTYAGELRLRSDVPARNGAMISMIRPDSPAAKAGLPLGGVIVAYDGQKVETAEDLVELIRASRPGQEVELTYYQGGTLKRKNVALAAAADPGLPGPGYGGLLRDRPLIGRVERALEGLARPGAGGALGGGPAAGAPGGAAGAAPGAAIAAAESASLRHEVEELKAKVEALEERVKELEAKLTVEKPAAGAGAAAPAEAPPAAAPPGAAPADEGAPVVPRVRAPAKGAAGGAPTLLPPKKPAGAKIGDE